MDALATLAPALGAKIDYVKMTFGSMLGDLAADKFDIAMSGMGRTFERARTATFSKPYMRYGKLMAVRNADKDRFKSIAELDKTRDQDRLQQGRFERDLCQEHVSAGDSDCVRF